MEFIQFSKMCDILDEIERSTFDGTITVIWSNSTHEHHNHKTTDPVCTIDDNNNNKGKNCALCLNIKHFSIMLSD